MTALLLALPSLVLAAVAVGLACWALKLARRSESQLASAIEQAEESISRRERLSHTAGMVDARKVKPEGLRAPLLTDDEAARAVADWNTKKAEALAGWVRTARPMTTDEADAWVADRAARLRRDLSENVIHQRRDDLGGKP